MAKQTRAQRKARREQQAESSLAQRAQRRQQQVRPVAQPPKSQTGARRPTQAGGGRRFIAECWGELQKVDWPGQAQVMQGTAVVLIACAIVGAYLWGADLILKRFVENILLGQ